MTLKHAILGFIWTIYVMVWVFLLRFSLTSCLFCSYILLCLVVTFYFLLTCVPVFTPTMPVSHQPH